MPLAGLRPAWIVARTRPRSAMRRIVQSPTEGSANEGNHGRLVVTPATRLGGEVQPAAPAFQAAPSRHPTPRPCVRGKFLFVGDEKLYVRGVTYGAFTPDAAGNEYHDLATVERDFAQMAANGINAVRIPHTTPPRALLDIASRHGLRVMVGLSAEQYVGYLIDRRPGAPDVEAIIRAKVRICAGHPALLCYALGNEIPALMARWLGRRKVERYLERLYRIVKEEDPEGLVTYVNYPTTEYLRLPFLDFVCFNVYLESQDRFEAYLARLQNIAGDRPLFMSELGLDALRNGEGGQARSLDWQVRTAFAAGCGGVFVFAWPDEWYRHGHDVENWAFGVTRADRSPKPALETVREAFAEVPFAPSIPWPRISVVVCSCNGVRTIRDACEGLRRLDYPNYEVIVVDDGSTDDAYPDPHWLTYLAATFLSTSHVGVGGPNIAPAGDGPIAECVARAPGGPVHVLITDREAEHIPGCNMAFRTAFLEAVGGFDSRFRSAGDDVDVCWRLQDRGWTLGYHPAAVVWHHRRNSVRTYWRQQIGYGRAEAMLERKWPEKYNDVGHVRWTGRMYGSGLPYILGWRRARVYHGVWGAAPFQSLYEPAPTLLASLPQMPEWHLMTAMLAGIAALGVVWSPLRLALPLLVAAILPPIAQACLGGARARFPDAPRGMARLARHALTAALHLIQPIARLRGRILEGLTPWRRRCRRRPGPLLPVTVAVWSEHWLDQDQRLRAMETDLRADGVCVLRGGRDGRWDLEVRGGSFGAARLLMGVEEHAGGKQLIRVRWWPVMPAAGPLLTLVFAGLTGGALGDQAWVAVSLLGFGALLFAARALEQCSAATATIREIVDRLRRSEAL